MSIGNILHNPKRPDVLAHVAGNVRRLRLARNLSQSGLAELSGISRRMIAAIEGDEANVSLSSLDRLAAALGVSFSEVVRPPSSKACSSSRARTAGTRSARAIS